MRRCLTAIDHISDLARENGITFVAEMFLGVFALPLEIKIFDAYYNDRRQGKWIPPSLSLPLTFSLALSDPPPVSSLIIHLAGERYAKVVSQAKQRCVAVIKADKAIRFLGGIFQSVTAAVRSVAALQRTSTPLLIFNNGVKFFCDDAFMSLTMRMAYPG